MDEHRIAGSVTNLGGKIKDAVGGLTGDSKMQAEGKAEQVSGQVRNAYGSAKDVVREGVQTIESRVDGLLHERSLLALLAAAGVGYLLARLTQR
jgi:uncharacterized protein YjbJ (UPF0337 family)